MKHCGEAFRGFPAFYFIQTFGRSNNSATSQWRTAAMRSKVCTVGLPFTCSLRVGSLTPIFLATQAIFLPRSSMAALIFKDILLIFRGGGAEVARGYLLEGKAANLPAVKCAVRQGQGAPVGCIELQSAQSLAIFGRD